MPHVKLGKYLRFYKSELLRYIGRTSARFGQQGLRSHDQTRYSTPASQRQSEPQEKGRCLWFNEVVFNAVMSTRQGIGVGKSGTGATGNPSSKRGSGCAKIRAPKKFAPPKI